MDKDNTIGVVVGNTTTDSYSFILTSMKGSKGDLVYTEADIPASESNKPSRKVLVWGRILSINRTNTAFPSEIAQEIAKEQRDVSQKVPDPQFNELNCGLILYQMNLFSFYKSPRI